jgi:phospholipid transport system substrate-binding protein
MISRRFAFVIAVGLLAGPVLFKPAAAQTAAEASAFMQQTGELLVQIVNGPGSDAQKATELRNVIDQRVDVDGIAKFVLGRFWRVATARQQEEYLNLFRRVLVISVDSKLGEYKGVSFTMERTTPTEGGQLVNTVIKRPSQAPANVEWLVQDVKGSPKITDVVAEGTSLRLTQRADYASFIVHNNDSIQALLDAMKKQVSG